MAKIKFSRIKDSKDIDNIPIEDGQIIFCGDGKLFTDYDTKRINSGGLNEDAVKKVIIDLIYPIGAIYENTKDSTNPGEIFGGTWQKLPVLFLTGAGEYTLANGEKVKYNAGDIIGEYKHQLTVEELAEHNHTIADRIVIWDAGLTPAVNPTNSGIIEYASFDQIKTKTTGNNKPFNLMPLSKVIYRWERVA